MSTVAIKCVSCGHFIPFGEMVGGGGARHEFEPLSEFGPERSEWVCARCVEKERRDDEETTRQWLERGEKWPAMNSTRALPIVVLLEAGANSIAIDGTPSQVGPTPEELHEAADTIEALYEAADAFVVAWMCDCNQPRLSELAIALSKELSRARGEQVRS